jgi:hypothetical protein
LPLFLLTPPLHIVLNCTVRTLNILMDVHYKKGKLNYFPPGRVWLVTSRLGTGTPLTFFNSVLD